VLTSETLRSRIDAAIFAAGGIPSRSIVAGGFQGADPHERGRGPLRANRPIVLDLFPRSRTTGYYGDITRTVVKGAPDPRTRAAFAAVTEAVRMARGGVAAGASCAEIHRRVAEHFERAGFPVSRRKGAPEGFFHGTGHGIGLDLHELPHVSLRGGRLEAGNVITLEPGLYYRSLGGIRIEEVVLVTRTGCRQLTRFPVFLEIP
jgi:Xaa-Pro aminopeptidase